MKSRLALWICKASSILLRRLGRGGTNLPGKLALRIDPTLLGTLARGVHVTVVTGTNGKTTTARMLEQAFSDAGLDYFCNKSGANLLTGIVTIFAQNCTLGGVCPKTHALIECDEAAFRTASRYLPIECLIVGNIFRDQLDRYGEITHTLHAIATGISHVPHATLCLNADCSLTASLAEGVPNPIVYFGINQPLHTALSGELSDALYCIHCKHPYQYTYHTYGHLGGFSCPSCGYGRHEPTVAVTEVVHTSADASDIRLSINGSEYGVHINLPGGYNIYNAVAAVAAAQVVGIAPEVSTGALSHFACGFGRAEQFSLGACRARMLLVKNPTGFNQVISLLSADNMPCKLAFLLNDRFADGTDISWIWDTELETLAAQQDRFVRILVGGVRAEDMAVRLKYAGFDPARLELMHDHEALLDALGADDTPAYLMPTYTAMFDLRGAIGKRTDLAAFYE